MTTPSRRKKKVRNKYKKITPLIMASGWQINKDCPVSAPHNWLINTTFCKPAMLDTEPEE